jgi:pyruvate kinase
MNKDFPMQTKTKIICTIGPSVKSLEKIMALMEAGMDVARLNFSHGTHAEHLESINLLKEARAKLQRPLAIMLDTKGPEIRLGKIKNQQFEAQAGHKILLVPETVEGDENRISLTPSSILKRLVVGAQLLFDDGYISAKVSGIQDQGVEIEIANKGLIRSGKSVCVLDLPLDLPAVTDKDIEDIRFGCQQDIDIIAASFVCTADDVLSIKKLLAEEKKPEILVCAKIENREGVHNFDSIVQVADGIMIARGDLGIQVPLSQVPTLQKMMIRKCYLAGKPSVTATQMLESMITNPRPTRAEASDVANAIYDSTSAIMLSGETAVGRYPIEAVHTMRSIVEEAERDFNYKDFFDHHASLVYHDVPSALTLAAVKTAYTSNAQAIFTFTSAGASARLVSRMRPSMPIVAMTPLEKTYHQLAFNWGVTPVLSSESKNVQEAFVKISEYARKNKIVSDGDLVVVTAGTPFGVPGTTNMMIVESIGEVLVRGHQGSGSRVHGNAAIVLTAESKRPYAVQGQILVLAQCDETYTPLISVAKAVVLQNHIDDLASEVFLEQIGRELNKPFLTRADGALNILKEGQLITLDPDKALIYKGVVL